MLPVTPDTTLTIKNVPKTPPMPKKDSFKDVINIKKTETTPNVLDVKELMP